MCSATLNFLSACAQSAARDVDDVGALAQEKRLPDLLELYCGNGNHTVALAKYFRLLLAVEIDKKLCDAAEYNLSTNGGITCVLQELGQFCKRLHRVVQRGVGALGGSSQAAGAENGEKKEDGGAGCGRRWTH